VSTADCLDLDLNTATDQPARESKATLIEKRLDEEPLRLAGAVADRSSVGTG